VLAGPVAWPCTPGVRFGRYRKVFGSPATWETNHARQLLHLLGPGMLVLADRGFDGAAFLGEVAATGAAPRPFGYMRMARSSSTPRRWMTGRTQLARRSRCRPA